MNTRPVALITGAGRKINIASEIARSLASDGWDICFTYWRAYDKSMPWGSRTQDIDELENELKSKGARVRSIETDLSLPENPAVLLEFCCCELGLPTALILSHCYSVDSDIRTTTVESFDRHFALNARAVWLLIREFEKKFSPGEDGGRIIALTSDHTAGNLPYGASKGALDRIVLASAVEFRDRNIRANVINPGANDTGWMNDNLKEEVRKGTLAGRLGSPEDTANLVSFLCSEKGGWINGQLLYSNGGLS